MLFNVYVNYEEDYHVEIEAESIEDAEARVEQFMSEK